MLIDEVFIQPQQKKHKQTLMTSMMVTNQVTLVEIQKELVYWVIELLGSDPVQ